MKKFLLELKENLSIYFGIVIASFILGAFGGLKIFSIEGFVVNFLLAVPVYVPIVLWKMFRVSKVDKPKA